MRGLDFQNIIYNLYNIDKTEKPHSINVANISRQIAIAMNLSKQEATKIWLAGRYHDIGKIYINSSIVTKEGALTDSEWQEMKTHTEKSYEILNSFKKYQHIALFALQHHERWDGKGYPNGLQKHEISLPARIIAIADSFDAMISKRSYKDAYSIANAIEEIKINAEKQFDPIIAQTFVDIMISTDYFFNSQYNFSLQIPAQ